jgi:hypothetical protein
MKRAMTILVCVLAAALAAAQSPQIIQNTKAKMDGVRNQATASSNEALGNKTPAAPASKGKPAAAKPSAVPAPAKAVPAAVPAKPLNVAAKTTPRVQPASAPARKSPTVKGAGLAVTKRVAAVSKASPVAASSGTADAEKSVEKQNGKWPMTGKRDPFVSPVVSQASGSGCHTGKKCLEIGLINFRGVVRSENGFIAVVTNSLNKAYFLRENDPVFDGYVLKITGDSIVFQETLQDRVGKTFTREVVKKITTPAV